MKFGLKLGKQDKPKDKPAAEAASPRIAELEEQLNGRADDLKAAEARLKKLADKNGAKDAGPAFERPHGPIEELDIEPEVDKDGDLADFEPTPEGELEEPEPEESAQPIKMIEVKLKPDGSAVEKPVTMARPGAPAAKVETTKTPPAAAKSASPQPAPAALKAEAPKAAAETKAEPPKEPKPEAAAAPAPKDAGTDLSALFAQDEEEENPLAALLRSLPEIETGELIQDIKEIRNIIQDWQKNRP